MDKRCENCKHWHYGRDFSFCKQDDQTEVIVPKFTCCDKHEPKKTKTTPFDGMKLYMKDASTGELSVKYTCEDCGKEMWDAPDRWWLVLPVNTRHEIRKPGYHFRCADCDKKKEGKI